MGTASTPLPMFRRHCAANSEDTAHTLGDLSFAYVMKHSSVAGVARSGDNHAE